ncbi:DUF4145 domain-containing protein [Planococcus lenghuensis]|uniref:DUF4145 domain-containing protein n=1 Tax=Planococcus lenghuensis TaxID=2213202 RepID=A0A1Q2L539_9BACL|nr:DUF4145 domain-containing protein [Planococcus lenghuensis]AQQ55568.1 hypothetical protein B0X71_20560 [Planococcus lenghuensis]
MYDKFIPPTYGKSGFSCPHCSVFSQQDWYEIEYNQHDMDYILSANLREKNYTSLDAPNNGGGSGYMINNLAAMSKCYTCDKPAFWIRGKIIYPKSPVAPLPNPDMPEDVAKVYREAREVSPLSPTASTALLRLALEKLLPQVGAKKSGIDTMIGELVGQGLPKEVEKALDSLRVIGNEAVHPGTIDLHDNQEVALALFKLLNFVVDRMITQKKEIDEIYELIPEEKLKGIERRNDKVLKEQAK